jgi:hypothetical protein
MRRGFGEFIRKVLVVWLIGGLIEERKRVFDVKKNRVTIF